MMQNEFFKKAFEDLRKNNRMFRRMRTLSEFIEGMVQEMKVQTFEPGEFLCHHLDIGKEMFVIYSGSVGVFVFIQYKEIKRNREELKLIARELIENAGEKFTEEDVLNHLKFP